MFITPLHVSIFFFNLFLVTFGLSFLMMKAWVVDAKGLANKVKDLILIGKTDKVVRLLGGMTAPFPKALLHLVRYSHRAYMLELVYHEARLKLLHGTQRRSGWATPVALVALGLIVTFLKTLGPGEDAGWILLFGGFSIALWLCTLFCVGVIQTHRRESVQQLTEVRNLLYQQAQYVPRHFLPVPEADLSSERVKEWRDSMDVFESDLLDREIQGKDVFTKYDIEADDDDGILPPLGE